MAERALIQQAGAIPFRVADGKLELCLITSARTGAWGFPKGFVDPGETPPQTALKEAREEAGLSGRILEPDLGGYAYSKGGLSLWVTVFLLEITAVAPRWPEQRVRQRRFCSSAEVPELLGEPAWRAMFERALERLGLRP
jgi:8-oxo-dGTP pyrophosphatase MutT (NUDIX family)